MYAVLHPSSTPRNATAAPLPSADAFGVSWKLPSPAAAGAQYVYDLSSAMPTLASTDLAGADMAGYWWALGVYNGAQVISEGMHPLQIPRLTTPCLSPHAKGFHAPTLNYSFSFSFASA
jgi:hypothetical protein